MAHQHQTGALLQDVLKRGERGANALVVAHRSVLHRDVEIDPHQDAFALQIQVTNRLLVHRRDRLQLGGHEVARSAVRTHSPTRCRTR